MSFLLNDMFFLKHDAVYSLSVDTAYDYVTLKYYHLQKI